MTKFGALVAVLFVVLAAFGGAAYWFRSNHTGILYSPLGGVGKKVEDRPLDKYAYENLRKREYGGSQIQFKQILKTTPEYTTWLFTYVSDGKTISGAANVPRKIGSPSAQESFSEFAKSETRPFDSAQGLIIMIHGFVEEKTYYSGFGTEHVAGELAKLGYVTVAPDLLGLGQSDPNPKDEFEARFQTYTTVLNLLATVEKYCSNPSLSGQDLHELGTNTHESNSSGLANQCRLGIWGHSNGGQIALSVLEISGKPIPTVLWAPVSKFFPYSILYYIDQFDDHGKYLRGILAKFEQKYDVEKYSLTNYLDWISAPILLQQGSADRDVPVWWSEELHKRLADNGKQIEYKVYPDADHNLQPGWDKAVADLEEFYKGNL